jgi:phospholipid-transporting ATPase
LIPISLYVIIEVLKLLLAQWVNSDVRMYCHQTGHMAICKNSDLIEELGQVEFVFSDKTGTLTQNVMEFKKCSVNGVVYDEHDFSNQALNEFFTLLAVCHTVVVDVDKGERKLQAASPDELALVQGAEMSGIELVERKSKEVIIRNNS